MKWLIAGWFSVITAHLGAAELQIYTHTTEGQVISENGHNLQGREHAGERAFYVELVRALLAELNLNISINEVPLARGLMMLKDQRNIVFFSVNRTPARENMASWVGPIKEKGAINYFYENPKHPTGIKILSDAKNLPVCVSRANTLEDFLKKQSFTHLVSVSNHIQCFNMLVAGRVSIVVSRADNIEDRLQSLGLSMANIQTTPVFIEGEAGYIALSKDVLPEEVKRWSTALQKIKSSGLFKQLYEQYRE
jgi:polar amino acid transport system substrate-binding protein